MARDKVHEAVKVALQKDGWLITHDPYQLRTLDVEYEIDLGAEEMVAAEKGGRKIAVEVKSFLRGSFATCCAVFSQTTPPPETKTPRLRARQR